MGVVTSQTIGNPWEKKAKEPIKEPEFSASNTENQSSDSDKVSDGGKCIFGNCEKKPTHVAYLRNGQHVRFCKECFKTSVGPPGTMFTRKIEPRQRKDL